MQARAHPKSCAGSITEPCQEQRIGIAQGIAQELSVSTNFIPQRIMSSDLIASHQAQHQR